MRIDMRSQPPLHSRPCTRWRLWNQRHVQGARVNWREGAMNITLGVWAFGAIALGSVCLVGCAVSPQGPTAQYRASPQGPDEQAVAQAFEALV
jgi:hypothetical protein